MNERERLNQIKSCIRQNNPDMSYKLTQLLFHIESPVQQNKIGKLLRRWEVGKTHAKIAVVGNHTTDGLEDALRFDAAKRQLNVKVLTTGFNQWAVQMLQSDSELETFESDVTVCSLDESVIYQHVQTDEWSVDMIAKALETAIHDITHVVSSFASRYHGTLVLHTIPLPSADLKSIIGYREKQRVSSLWRKFNVQLLELHTTMPNVITLDFDVLTQGASQIRDERLKYFGSMSYSVEAWQCLSSEIVAILAAKKGLTKKVLALDLDQTIWGGIIGDDGVKGIALSDTFPGNQYKSFQKIIRRLHEQGVLLTIASKNDWKNVKSVFEENEHMVLKEEAFTQIFCHWEPKTDSLRKMATQLNLGLDSFLFIDDNPFERQLMQQEIPEVTVIPIGKDPSRYLMDLLENGWFNTLALTNEDRERSQKYKQLVKHEKLKESSTSLEDYLKQLQMVIKWTKLEEDQISRVTQLSQRTNQFNLTTERLTEADVTRTMDMNVAESIYTFSLEDRFGDNGLVGYFHVSEEGKTWRIRNAVMSCRVFKRQVETEALHLLFEEARSKGVQTISGTYRQTAKNGFVAAFYEEHGFKPHGGEWLSSCNSSLPKVPWIQQQLTSERVKA
ncbi:HAD-IIIC family phosphatase [Salipaludibacillus agaradhaerens]|uniref:HAD-IIIC family phosphatase n=1 Tax=Salipaludibacillus agaradhaerens TaxID=76935 RepID=A0A9Q4G190_SALAG|nr:HAD family hydrolase [Salipaludibacillus agaradhaerens]MCR6098792.1 HAD-IIIC family phosphatase [Salipaludibacillus agaradhaerens]MCR6115799.1 HAD-IIIC family phosphatase [Salipaludibacillus agaradhaerens]